MRSQSCPGISKARLLQAKGRVRAHKCLLKGGRDQLGSGSGMKRGLKLHPQRNQDYIDFSIQNYTTKAEKSTTVSDAFWSWDLQRVEGAGQGLSRIDDLRVKQVSISQHFLKDVPEMLYQTVELPLSLNFGNTTSLMLPFPTPYPTTTWALTMHNSIV